MPDPAPLEIIDLPAGSVRVEDFWIPLSDGTRLHARGWFPGEPAALPAPVILEYLPYRIDDWTSVRDSERHPFYAAHGYVSVRVDIRGTGSSDGHFADEYSPAELDDGEEVVRWLARQSWSSGRVGMFGISWGGFNSLQLAGRGIEELAAIVTVCSADDRYDNDVHYMGGALLGIDMSAWAATMFAFASRPPRPEVVGDRWIEMWRERLEQQRPLAPVWMSHQERDDFWRRGSACEDYAAVTPAVLAVGGWADPYHDTVFRLLDHLSGPRKGILGPWSHQYPDRGLAPGPGIDFLGETLRWFDRYLKDQHTGVEDDPDLRVWMGESTPPATYRENAPGGWRAIEDFARPRPSARLPLGGTGTALVRTPLATGQDAGRFFPFGNQTDLPPDQRAEDGRSLCFDLAQTAGLDILGSPELRLRVRSAAKRANIIVRLSDIAPDGSSTLVTRGVLNLAKRHGMDRADDLTPGAWEEISVRLVAAGHRVLPGHRLRVAISDQYWPWIWPHGEIADLEIDLASAELSLPLLPEDAGTEVSFDPPRHVRPIAITAPPSDAPPRPERRITQDVATGETVLEVDPGYGGSRVYPDGLVFSESAWETYRIREDDPTSAQARSEWDLVLTQDQTVGEARRPWRARISTVSTITATAEEFIIENRVLAIAEEADRPAETLAERTFLDRVPRTSA